MHLSSVKLYICFYIRKGSSNVCGALFSWLCAVSFNFVALMSETFKTVTWVIRVIYFAKFVNWSFQPENLPVRSCKCWKQTNVIQVQKPVDIIQNILKVTVMIFCVNVSFVVMIALKCLKVSETTCCLVWLLVLVIIANFT